MATTKAVTAIANGLTMTASAGDVTSSSVNIDTGYGGVISVKITNGATGPTVAGQCQVQTSSDDSEYYDFGGPLVGLTSNSGIASWVLEVPMGVEYIRIVTGSNTGQNTTADVDLTNVTAVS